MLKLCKCCFLVNEKKLFFNMFRYKFNKKYICSRPFRYFKRAQLSINKKDNNSN